VEHVGTFWNILEHFGTFWNILEHFVLFAIDLTQAEQHQAGSDNHLTTTALGWYMHRELM
jgi:hypothetical protein